MIQTEEGKPKEEYKGKRTIQQLANRLLQAPSQDAAYCFIEAST